MGQSKPFNEENKNNLKHRAWNSLKEFFGKDEPEHPLSPELISTLAKHSSPQDLSEDPNEERMHRSTERRRISENPASTWPG